MALKLTARQSQILTLIRQAITHTGRPPTRAEIAHELGFRSTNAAEDHLRALERKGYVHLSAGTSRGIQLVQASPADTAHPVTEPASLPFRLLASARELLVPIIGHVAAGHPILAAEHIEREVPVAAQLFTAQPDYLLRVRGSSMCNAGILDGDLLAVRSTREAHHGQIVVARLGDDVTVKRLEQQGSHLRLLPENPDFTPIVIGPGDDFAIEGLAVGLIRTTPLH
ncbi:MAG TPA: transcriptional repressor LexA [Castellaniella sp.]|uniref:transcriptional repressor LexA n=1 Tax=Castellaniella sp. TaxID=1955812 RepID=UPI002EE95FF0